MNSVSENRNKLRIGFIFHLILFSYPLLSLLWRRSYPFLTAEVALLFISAIVAALIFSFINLRVRQAVAYLLTTVLIICTLTIQLNLLLEGILISLVCVLLLIYLLKDRFQRFSIPILLALIAGAFFDSLQQHGWERPESELVSSNPDLPPVIHIMLDGFIGPAGLPDYPASKLVHKEITSFFREYDFQLWSHAYSRYAATGNSLNSAMNFRHDGASKFGLEIAGRQEQVMRNNRMFDALDDLGYRLNIYQTGQLDFCQSNTAQLDRCWQYDHPNINSVHQNMSVKLRFHVLRKTLLEQSRIFRDLLSSSTWRASAGVAVHDPRIFSILADDVGSRGYGNYFFAHSLLPHGPFAYQSDCSVNYDNPVSTRITFRKTEPVQADHVYELRNGRYFGQIDCALLNLRSLFNTMNSKGILENSIIMVHGDHGSLISSRRPDFQNAGQMSMDDYRAGFSTLFAVKYPGSHYSVNDHVVPVSYLLEEFTQFISQADINKQNSDVFESSIDDNSVRTHPHVFLIGTYPMRQVDIDIFENQKPVQP